MPITRTSLEDLIGRRLDERRGGWIVTANLEFVRRVTKDAAARRLVEAADVVVADGAPVVWASRVAGRPVPERVAGSDLIWSLSDRVAGEGRSIYLLGGESPARAARVLVESSPGLRVAGWHCPAAGFERSAAELASLERRLIEREPDVVYVGLGFPKQEMLISRLRDALPRAWFIGVGVSIDFVAGRVRRAPQWMREHSLEWLYRMSQEPRKLTARYLLHGLPFAARLLAWSVAARLGRP